MSETGAANRQVGYARVSTTGQTLDAQLAQLKDVGCQLIYSDTASGARVDRKELQRMLGALRAGDVVTVTRIDRLARSTFDLFAIDKLIEESTARFRSLAEPWADTATSTGRLMLAVLGSVADVERDLTNQDGRGARLGEGEGQAHGQTAKTQFRAAA